MIDSTKNGPSNQDANATKNNLQSDHRNVVQTKRHDETEPNDFPMTAVSPAPKIALIKKDHNDVVEAVAREIGPPCTQQEKTILIDYCRRAQRGGYFVPSVDFCQPGRKNKNKIK